MNLIGIIKRTLFNKAKTHETEDLDRNIDKIYVRQSLLFDGLNFS